MKALDPALAARLAPVLATVGQHAAESDEKASFPVEGLTAMRNSGLLGLLVPARYGGLDGTVHDLLAVSQLIARQDMSAAMVFAMHGQQVAALVHHASEELRERVLPGVARGDLYLGSVTTEAARAGICSVPRPVHGVRATSSNWTGWRRSSPAAPTPTPT